MSWSPTYEVIKTWMSSDGGGPPAMVLYKTPNDAKMQYRVGYLTVDTERGFAFMQHSRWLNNEVCSWGTSRTPSKKVADKEMVFGAKGNMMLWLKHIDEVHFLEPAVWKDWLEKP